MSRISGCRSCGSPRLETVLSLGETPLANALLREEDLARPERRYPLELAFCPTCSLVQITETVPPEELFREYVYFSSFSDTMLRHSKELVARLVRELALGPESLAVEVASNDGYLLQYYKQVGIPVLGIEPARNVAEVAMRERGIPTVTEFFGSDLARQLAAEGRRADVLHANNVLAHVADLNGFVAGIALQLAETGVAVIEVPYLGEMIPGLEFDTIYHEHLCYFSLTALDGLFRRHELLVADVERIPLHGGSLLLTAAHLASGRPCSPRVAALLAREAGAGLTALPYYADFAPRVAAWRGRFRVFLEGLRRPGGRLAAYGAAAKGSTLLNFASVGRDLLDFVVDRSTHKQGRYMPGVHLPIRAPGSLLEEMPDAVVLLTWNFKDEILAQQAEYRRRGGKFVVPIPEIELA
jgi:C-methyltransferase C-terminal domain/Putative zinc binding domain/Methyltransferase domain